MKISKLLLLALLAKNSWLISMTLEKEIEAVHKKIKIRRQLLHYPMYAYHEEMAPTYREELILLLSEYDCLLKLKKSKEGESALKNFNRNNQIHRRAKSN